jgi:MraZ protein
VPVFSGVFAHTLDDKGRLMLPARLRAELMHGLAVARGSEPCLTVFPLALWQEIARLAATLPFTHAAVRSFNRTFFSRSFELMPDRLGRILIPGQLREYAAIEDEAVIVGANAYLEVWSPRRWEQTEALETENMSSTLAAISTLGITL